MSRPRSPLGEAIFSELWCRGDDVIIPRDIITSVLDVVPFSVIPKSHHGRAIDYVLSRIRILLHSSKDSWGDKRWVFVGSLGGWRRFDSLTLEEHDEVSTHRQHQVEWMTRASSRLQSLYMLRYGAAERGVFLTMEEAQVLLAEA